MEMLLLFTFFLEFTISITNRYLICFLSYCHDLYLKNSLKWIYIYIVYTVYKSIFQFNWSFLSHSLGGVSSTGNIKDCAVACISQSFNFGYVRMTTSCCNTDRCNLQDVPGIVLQSSCRVNSDWLGHFLQVISMAITRPEFTSYVNSTFILLANDIQLVCGELTE